MNSMTGVTGIITRDITSGECPWFETTIKKGLVVFEYIGCAFGCITDEGMAVCLEPNEFPFVEIPRDAVIWEK